MTASVYLIPGKSGGALYVGCAVNLDRRLKEHRNRPFMRTPHTVRSKRFPALEEALIFEARAISLLRPTHNIMGQRDGFSESYRQTLSRLTKAGIAAKKARGETMGRPKTIEDNRKRMAAMRRLHKQGRLFDERGNAASTDAEVLIVLNKADKDADPIGSTQTVARWRKAGYPGLDEGDQA